MCNGEFKLVDYPTVDDRLSNEVLKSSGRMKQENNNATMKGKRTTKTVENQCYEVGSEGTIFNHPRQQNEEREAFERYLFKHLQPYWEKLPKPLATLHRAYVREYLETYRIKATRKYCKGS